MHAFFAKIGFLGYPLLLSSIFSVAIIFERLFFWFFNNPDRYVLDIEIFNNFIINNKKINEDMILLKLNDFKDNPIIDSVIEGINCKFNKLRFEDLLNHVIRKNINSAERFLTILSTIIEISPLLGLLGTVTGMIKTFMVIQKNGNDVNISILAGGIWEAMLTTAFGLSIAIISLIFLNYFNERLNRYIDRFEHSINEMLLILEKINII